MKAREIYKRFLLRINKNDTNDGVNILPSLFVLMFNTEQTRWLGQKLTKDSDNIKIDHLDGLFLSDVEIEQSEKGDGWVEFLLPKDIYRHAYSFAFVSKGNCKDVPFYYFEKKPLGFSVYLNDDSNKAHFDYEEGPMQITQGKVKAYTDNFEISKFLLSYYRVPPPIDIAGYTKIDGSESTDIDCNLSDDNIDEILTRVTIEAIREYQDTDGFQFAKDREATEP